MKLKLIGVLMLSITLLLSPIARAQVLDTSKLSVNEENEVRIVGLSNKTKLAKLTPNYEKDYNDLLQQLMSLDKSYQEWKEEYNSKSITSERLEEIEFLILSKETNFKATAKELLSTRYTEDKKQILPEIIEEFKGIDTSHNSSLLTTSAIDYDIIVYPDDYTEYTGNYASTSGSANYSSSYNNNRSSINVTNTGIIPISATVLHGWKFVPIIEYPYLNIPVYEFNFRYVEADYELACLSKGSASLELSTEIYDATSNSIIGSHNLGNWYCLDGDYTDVNLTPTKVTFSYIGFYDNHRYTAYVKTHGMATKGTVIGMYDGNFGTKWGYLEVDFY